MVSGMPKSLTKKSCVAVLHMLTHMAVHPLSCSHRHFLMCTLDAMVCPISFSSVSITSMGPTIHAKTTLVMTAFSSSDHLVVGKSARNTLSPPGGISERMMPRVISRWPSKSRPRIWRKHRAMNSS